MCVLVGVRHTKIGPGGPDLLATPPADYAEQADLTGPNLLGFVTAGQLSTKPPIGPGHGVY